MKKSFLIPNEGLRVKHVCYETFTYPIITQLKLDNLARDSLGTYYMNNGIVVFVYRDGHTYVTKGYKVIKHLCDAGYREKCMFVPFSNGEEIMHDGFRAKWESIRKWR